MINLILNNLSFEIGNMNVDARQALQDVKTPPKVTISVKQEQQTASIPTKK